MQLEQINTWSELSDYLLDRMDYADDSQSNSNKTFTKEQHWNSLIGDCARYEGEDLPIRTKSILIKRVKKDFGMLMLT